MKKTELLKKKIGRDDVIILNEDLLPREVMPLEYLADDTFTVGRIYKVLGISWITYPDRSRALGYILINDKSQMDIYMSSWFTVVDE